MASPDGRRCRYPVDHNLLAFDGLVQDKKAVLRARVALRDLLDGPVKLSPSPEGKHFVAKIGFNPKILLPLEW